ncbi:MAG TPA: RICIN domain-containing protein [Rugosimonospora sp.]|nr:RICIN domain-containing protein [Rugosimonospora sp.]
MVNLRRSAVLLFASVVAAAASFAIAAPAHAATGPFTIQNFGSGKCIQLDPSNSGPDIQVVQEDCNRSNPAQLWFFDPLGGQDYHIINALTFNCLRVAGGNVDRAPVQTIDCTTISDERFSVAGSLPTTVPHQIISRISGGNRCLDVSNGSTDNGAKIQIFHCTTDNSAQVFNIG